MFIKARDLLYPFDIDRRTNINFVLDYPEDFKEKVYAIYGNDSLVIYSLKYGTLGIGNLLYEGAFLKDVSLDFSSNEFVSMISDLICQVDKASTKEELRDCFFSSKLVDEYRILSKDLIYKKQLVGLFEEWFQLYVDKLNELMQDKKVRKYRLTNTEFESGFIE